ncbi:vWA domain-containing protein [Roseovarius pelagicus]|uniref:VWA domain-containing protein n=1 Tax=Roseovarius pelagicus TaxID=2980108 RepID=A0ABY6DCC0_9RHOB|nr:VWA domain-containing protein [Roseovarius pelagicus]UXX83802.1 VWA domain-containing protein [Roseovarius pelagicus]
MCDWMQGLVVWDMALLCEAAGWLPMLATVFAVLVIALSIFWAFRRRVPMAQAVGAALVSLAAILLATATGLPVLQPLGDPPPGGRVAVLIDASESVRRDGDGAVNDAREIVASRLQDIAESLPEEADWRGSVRAFGATTRSISADTSLSDLPASIRSADLGALANTSNLARAVEAGMADIADGPGAGMIFLISDGLETDGDILAAAETAAQSGVAIHTLGVGSLQPAMGLLSHNIGPDQAIGRPAVLRATLQGGGVLRWGINGLAEPERDVADAGRPMAVRIPVEFPERGLNFVDLGFSQGKGEPLRTEHVYTLVRGPARALVFGGASWVDGADPARFLIERASPGDDVDFGTYDVVVIDGLEPINFPSGTDQRLSEAAAGGVGLFLVNGPLRGNREDQQRLADWEETVLGEVLPVNSDPALYIRQPPKRDLLIIIDTSGSMGPYMSVAREAANKVIDAVRPQDSLTIVSFSSGAGLAFTASSMPPSEVARARRAIADLSVGGDTMIEAAINQARLLRGNNCALFIIGDGGYERDQIKGRPICFTTAIGVANEPLPGIDTNWGEQVPIRTATQLGRIEFKAFKPEPREEFWRDGPLEVIPADEVSHFEMRLPVGGIALSYPRPESSHLSIMADPPRAPVLAFRREPKLTSLKTGVFLGSVPIGLPVGPQGWASTVLDELAAWDDPERFDIDLSLSGEDLKVRITPLGGGPVPARISVAILLPDGSSTGLSMRAQDAFGAFEGIGRISLSNTTMRGNLMVDLGNGEVQEIPIRLPARSRENWNPASTQEAFGFGVNNLLLSEIRAASGGIDLAVAVPDLMRARAELRPVPLWPWFAGLAAALFAGSLFLGGVRR